MDVFPSALLCNLEGIQAGGCKLLLAGFPAFGGASAGTLLSGCLLVVRPLPGNEPRATFSYSMYIRAPCGNIHRGRVRHPADRGCALARGGFSWTAVSSSPCREREREILV